MATLSAELRANAVHCLDVLLKRRMEHRLKPLDLTLQQLVDLGNALRLVLSTDPVLLEIEGPVTIVGDIHGQFQDLVSWFDSCGHPPDTTYLFLGDYVDRGKQSIEVFGLLAAYKIKYPDKIYLLRGNHEHHAINRIHGWAEEAKMRYAVKLFVEWSRVFNYLPLAAIVETAGKRLFACHGGISPELHKMDDIRAISRPCDIPDNGLICDLVWSDPDDKINGWGENDRGVSHTWGSNVTKVFLKEHDFTHIVRAHQVVVEGHKTNHHGKVITVFSAPNYCGEFDNKGSVMRVEADGSHAFVQKMSHIQYHPWRKGEKEPHPIDTSKTKTAYGRIESSSHRRSSMGSRAEPSGEHDNHDHHHHRKHHHHHSRSRSNSRSPLSQRSSTTSSNTSTSTSNSSHHRRHRHSA